MKKKDLLNDLKDSLHYEDEFLLKYDSESTWSLIEGSVPTNKIEEVKNIFEKNIHDTKKHSKILRNLIKEIEESTKDDY